MKSTIEVKALKLTDTGESFVELAVRGNVQDFSNNPTRSRAAATLVRLSLREAIFVAEMLWGVVGDIRRADASGRVKTPSKPSP